MCRFLVECKADINAKDTGYRTPYSACSFKVHFFSNHIVLAEGNLLSICRAKKAMPMFPNFSWSVR
jgi:hypothetical protein